MSTCDRSSYNYIVIGFDYGDTYDVTVHACTRDAACARRVYQEVFDFHNEENSRNVNEPERYLVQLIRLPPNHTSDFVAFWGENSQSEAISEASNNG